MTPTCCPTCKAVLPARELSEGWCENCGKKIPPYILKEYQAARVERLQNPIPNPTPGDYLAAFENREYLLCTILFSRVLEGHPKTRAYGITWQIFLISSQRIQMSDIALEWGSHLVATRKGLSPSIQQLEYFGPTYEFETLLLELTLGLIELQDVLANAKSDLQRCPAYYYAGARCLTLGKKVEARTLYDACLAISSDCLERTLAEIERKSVADAV